MFRQRENISSELSRVNANVQYSLCQQSGWMICVPNLNYRKHFTPTEWCNERHPHCNSCEQQISVGISYTVFFMRKTFVNKKDLVYVCSTSCSFKLEVIQVNKSIQQSKAVYKMYIPSWYPRVQPPFRPGVRFCMRTEQTDVNPVQLNYKTHL